MKKILEFIIFIAYTILIFFIKSYNMFFAIFLIHILTMLIFRISIKKAVLNILKISFIIIFTSAINMMVVDINTGILIGLRLIIICNATYIFSKKFNYMDLSNVIQKIFGFMKIFNINPKDIGTMVCVAVAFIPILEHEMHEIKNSLKSKGFKMRINNIHLILQPFFTSILKKISNIEDALIAKGYE